MLNKRDFDNSVLQKIKNIKDNMGWFKPIFAYSALSFRRVDFDSKLKKLFKTKPVDKNIENVNELKNKSAKNMRMQLIDWQIDQLKKAYGSKLSILFISDSPVIKEGRIQILEHDSDFKLKIMEACKNSGIQFIDTRTELNSAYLNEGYIPFGFNNLKIGVGHLNEIGHEIISKVLVKHLINIRD